MSAEEVPVATDVERERWLQAQVAKAPPWTHERLERLAIALDYDVQRMSTDSTGKGR